MHILLSSLFPAFVFVPISAPSVPLPTPSPIVIEHSTMQAAPAARTATAPELTSSASLTYAQQIEQEIYKLINSERTKKGLLALTYDARLAEIARAHSQDMITNNYFSHTNLSGCNAACRYKNAGYAYWSMGENIYTMWGSTPTASAAAQKIVSGWMASAGHKANILNANFTHQGIGVATKGTKINTTQNFSKPR